MNFLIKFLVVIFVIGCVDKLFGYVPTQVRAFKNAVQSNKQGINCASCDFRGVQEFAGLDAHGVYMPGASFQPCYPNAVNQTTPMICIADQVANMTGINLANANLFSVCLDAAILDNADLSGADLTNASAAFASFKGAKVAGIITTNATFCNAVMPDGAICTESWTGQGVTIQCNCTGLEPAIAPAATSTSQSAAVAPATAATTPTPAASPAPKTSAAPAA